MQVEVSFIPEKARNIQKITVEKISEPDVFTDVLKTLFKQGKVSRIQVWLK